MPNSPTRPSIRYAPRSGQKCNRVAIKLNPSQLAECRHSANTQGVSAAAYVLEVYLQGHADRRRVAARKKSPQAVYKD